MASLQIPLAIWKNFLILDVQCTLAFPQKNWLFLGLRSGRIIRLDIDVSKPAVNLSMILVGHHNPIVSLQLVKQRLDQQCGPTLALLSADQQGEIALWCVEDGRCLLHNVMALDGELRGIVLSSDEEYIFIYGHCNIVNVVRVGTLEVVQNIPIIGGKWISCAVNATLNSSSDNSQDEIILFPISSNRIMSFSFDLGVGRAVSNCDWKTYSGSHPSNRVRNCLRIGNKIYVSDTQNCWNFSIANDSKLTCQPLLSDPSISIKKIFQGYNDELMIETFSSEIFDILGNKIEIPTFEKCSTRFLQYFSGEILDIRCSGKNIQLELIGKNLVTSCPVLNGNWMYIWVNYLNFLEEKSVTCTTLSGFNDQLKVIHGFQDGTIQLLTLFDGFLSFNGILNDRFTLPKSHSSMITFLEVEDDLLISGDVSGMISFYQLSSLTLRKSFHHHSFAIIGFTPISKDKFYLIIDVDGRASIIDKDLKFVGFLGNRNIPILQVKWTTNGEFKVALVFQDDRIQIWNISTGQCEKECSALLSGMDELLQPFKGRYEVKFKGARHPQLQPLKVGISDTPMFLRSGIMNDPLQIIIIDLRKFIDIVHKALTNVPGPDDSTKERINQIVVFVLSILFPWGLDNEFDSLARKLGFSKPKLGIIPGILGANGNASFVGPTQSDHLWKLSSTFCASLHLSLSSIFNLPLEMGEEWERLGLLSSARLIEIGVEGEKISIPSISFASKYWHDLMEEIRHASRLIILQSIHHIDHDVLSYFVIYWQELLPSNEQLLGKKMNRASIILGIIALHCPEVLSERTRELVAKSLMNLLVDENRTLFRSAAIELIGKAFPVWERYVHAISVFRLLLNWLSGMSQVDESGPVVQLVVPVETVASLDTLESVRSTLIKLAIVAADDIIPLWVGQDFIAARSVIEKWTSISLLSDIVKQQPIALFPYITMITDAIHRMIDNPSHINHSKQRILAITMPLIFEMLEVFPCLSYHREIFRLASGNPQGDCRIHIYDLRGSSSTRLLEGHTSPVTSLSFSPDGRLLLSYSFEEATLRWWHVPGTFSGLLGGTIRPYHTEIVQPTLTESLLNRRKPNPDISNLNDLSLEGLDLNSSSTEQILKVKFHWNDDRTVNISVDGKIVSHNSIPT